MSILTSLGGSPPIPFNTLEITSELQSEIEEFNRDGWVGDTLLRRAKSKFLNVTLMDKMTRIQSPLMQSYQDTYFCSHQITVTDNKAKSCFCKKRWCIICNRIRTAQLIQAYMPTLDTWVQKTFLTLTIKNVPKEKLKGSLSEMYKTFSLIKDIERKRGFKLVGIRKLECTYNRQSDEYHPHYHIILNNSDRSEIIINEWLERFQTADRKGQDFRPADKDSCFELFKYFTKLSSNSKKDNTITVNALDNIFQSITGVRTFQPFGFIANKLEPPPENITLGEQSFDIQEYQYNTKQNDWINPNTGEFLTNYEINQNEKSFKYRIR
ncbi:MAG: protein rep [Spirosomaceae bacterium]|jgi:plasmid rolling circle replication initiator protein Rep|nr:protein rep [Spirosomataceae bacterium]